MISGSVRDGGGRTRLRAEAARSGASRRTLTREHALLLEQVAARVGNLLRVTAEERWPAPELQALLEYLRAEVLRHAADEERRLFPANDLPPELARLGRDHTRLRAGAEVLARAAGGESTRSPGQIAVIARDLLAQFERHLALEEGLLAAARRTDTGAR